MRFGVGLDLWSKTKIATSFEVPKPVADDKQIAKWTGQISAAPDFLTLKKVAHEIGEYHIEEETRLDLVATWKARKEEIENE